MNKISLIIPVYNVRDYLFQCLDSLYKQIDETVEIILVNDGSTDDSLAICRKYVEKYPNTKVIDKENGGLSDARNVGTDAATGDYIYYLDSDDWLAPNAIKTLYDFAVENQCDIVQGGFYYAYDDHLLYDAKYNKPFVLERNKAMLELIKNDYVKNFAWGKLYRTDIAKKHQFPKGKFYEDAYWQHLIIHECNRYGIVPTPLYYYRQRSSGISGKFSLKNLDLLRGYEERLSFVLFNYPQYTKLMVERLWRLGYFLMTLSKHTNEKRINIEYSLYWEKLNREKMDLFEKSMKWNLRYQLHRKCSMLLPLYDLFERFVNRFKLSSMIKEYRYNNVKY